MPYRGTGHRGASLSSLATRRTTLKEHVYSLLVAEPHRIWSVAEVRSGISPDARASIDAVRDILYVLISDGAAVASTSAGAVTIFLTADGIQALRATLGTWR
jgi:hypothetical protein